MRRRRIWGGAIALGLVASAAWAANPSGTEDSTEKPAARIVAIVNDNVILLEEVLGPIRGQLLQAKKSLPRERYLQVERELLKQATQQRIQRVVLLKELETILPDKSIMKRIRAAAAQDFDSQLIQMAHNSGMKTKEEIIEKIKSEGSDLDALRRDFTDNLLAQQYLYRLTKNSVKEPTRDELVAYYDAHKEEFSEPAGAVWRQIRVKFADDKFAARRKIQDAADQLKAGADFGQVAQKMSDGPTAAVGGLWSLTSKDSYADSLVDHAIFSIPVGETSEIIEGKEAFHIVHVERRTEGGPRPFSEVQTLIKNKLQRDSQGQLHKKTVDDIIAKYHVETIFDEPNKSLDQAAAPNQPPR